ncbi:MAG: hypothetical protein ACP5XB_05325 [Isosphaeraceae bacterium]
MKSARESLRHVGLISLALCAVLFICQDVIASRNGWGKFDWDLFFFHATSTYRGIVEFGEPPLWNPWYRGGFPMIGNPQVPSPGPWFVLDLLAGPIVAIKLKIVGHYLLGLASMYWCCRQMSLSRLASSYAAGTFVFSTWLALHLHSGHLWVLTAVYIPLAVGLLYRARTRWNQASYGGLVLAVMILEGGSAHIVTLLGITLSILALAWSIEQRSLRPIAALALLLASGIGLSAVKMLPCVKLLREYPRYTWIGGAYWDAPRPGLDKTVPSAGTRRSGENSTIESVASANRPDEAHPSGSRLNQNKLNTWKRPPNPAGGPRQRLQSALAIFVKSFLGREQRSNKFYLPIQTWGWHEYGFYIGPLAVLLAAGSPLLVRKAWPWMIVALFCLLVSPGNFARFAPWTLMHHLPVLSNMRNPTRFLIPGVFAACILCGLTLDAAQHWLRAKFAGSAGKIEIALALVVSAALVDSLLMGRASLAGVFDQPAPSIEPRLPTIVTIEGQTEHTTEAMLANYCVLSSDEVIGFPIRVAAREQADYRGEVYFVADGADDATGDDRVQVERWSPNSVRVRVTTDSPGVVVLNRNWESPWTADSPRKSMAYRGLIAARVEPGTHTIQFRYRPAIVYLGLTISVLSLLAVLGSLFLQSRALHETHAGDECADGSRWQVNET